MGCPACDGRALSGPRAEQLVRDQCASSHLLISGGFTPRNARANINAIMQCNTHCIAANLHENDTLAMVMLPPLRKTHTSLLGAIGSPEAFLESVEYVG